MKASLELAQVVVGGAVEDAHLPHGLRRPQVRSNGGLDALLGLVRELRAVAAEELDPVVLPGVVRGGDDDGQVEPQPADQDRGGRRRHDPGDQRVSPALRHARGQRALEHRAGLAGVADDQDLRALGPGLVGCGAPSATASSAVSASPATPRTPSVPKSRLATGAILALGELRPLAGLLEAGLAALLLTRVTREHAPALELAAEFGIDLDQGASGRVANRVGLTGDAAAVDADLHVDLAVIAGGDERLAGDRAVKVAREVVLDLLAVDEERALALSDDDAGDRGLPLAGRLDAGAGGKVELCALAESGLLG